MDETRNSQEVQEAYLTPTEAAQLLPDVTRRTVQLWAKQGKLPNAFQLPSGHWRIARRDIEAIYGGTVQ